MPEPILVDRLTSAQAVRIRCTACGYERDLDVPDELNQDATWPCTRCGQWKMEFKYHEAPRCGNCEKLGFWDVVGTGDGFCSRVCKLQAEYVKSKAAG